MRSKRMRSVVMLLVSLLIVGSVVLAFEFGKRLVEGRQDIAYGRSACHFGQIQLMLHNYHNEYGSFPPTRYQAAPNGPTHSWRVLLLPYMDVPGRQLYAKYDFTKEWNSPDNLKVSRSLSPVTQVFSLDRKTHITNYLTVGKVDKWPTWPYFKPLNAYLVTAGEDRFLLVEYPDSQIYWTRPKY